MNYEEKTKAELLALVEERGLTVKAKNPKKPTNAEIIAVLEFENTETPIENEVEDDGSLEVVDAPELEKTEEKKEQPAAPKKAAKKDPKKMTDRQIKNYLDARVKVIIHDNYTGEKLDEEADDHMYSFSVGNRKIQSRTEFVRVGTHEPQTITRLGKAHLEGIMMPAHMWKKGKRPTARMVPRFTIQEISEGVTAEELEQLKKQRPVLDAAM